MKETCPFCLNEYELEHKPLYEPRGGFLINAEITYEETDGSPLLSINIPDLADIWGVSIDIAYCPMCGRKLEKNKRE